MLKKPVLYKVICFSIICAVMLISGCSSAPKDLIRPESKLEMSKAEEIIAHGKRMIFDRSAQTLLFENEVKITLDLNKIGGLRNARP